MNGIGEVRSRTRVRRLLAPVALALCTAGCQFGLDYSGDESGLTRAALAVQEHEDWSLSYLSAGDETKPRVIFIHGSPGSAVMYNDYFRDLGDVAEVVAVDRLGYGASATSGPVLAFEDQAAAIAPLLVEREGRWPIVIGHSLGGPIAARLAADFPGRVGGLIIAAGGLDPDLEEPRWYNEVARWWIVYPFMAGFLQVSNKEMWACREQVSLLDPLLDRIECPVVVIHGSGDTLVPFETIDHTIERLANNPEVYVVVLVGEDHSVTMLRREEVLESIHALLQGSAQRLEEDE